MQVFFRTVWFLSVAVAALPGIYFWLFGWGARRAEFLDKVRVGATDIERDAMVTYFEKFWSNGLAKYKQANPGSAAVLQGSLPQVDTFWMRRQTWPKEPAPGWRLADAQHAVLRDMFKLRYGQLIGRRHYIAPYLLLLAVVAVLSGLVCAAAVRTGYDEYFEYEVGLARVDAKAEADDKLDLGAAETLRRIGSDQLQAALAPVPRIDLSLQSMAAIAGAYLFVLAQLIQQCRARTLVYSDLFAATLRLLLSVPLGLSMTAVAPPGLGAALAFGLGAFPIRDLTLLLRRKVASVFADDARADDDQTVGMVGVTQGVSDRLAEENITCAQQLADIDPVVLAVRTGLSFDYVLFLVAQALVWCFLGRTAGLLGPLGYGDARAIWFLVKRQPPEQRLKVLASLAKHAGVAEQRRVRESRRRDDASPLPDCNCIDARLLGQAFAKIALDPYTLFLVHFTSDLDTSQPNDTTTGSAPANSALAWP